MDQDNDDYNDMILKNIIANAGHDENDDNEITNNESTSEFDNKDSRIKFPPKLADSTLEKQYIGLLLNEVESIAVYYFKYEDCYFVDENMLNLYKKIIYTDAERYAPAEAKEGFNFARETQELYNLKLNIKDEYENSTLDIEQTYTELKKIFILRKNYLGVPVKKIQEKIAGILEYELYSKMTPEDIISAVEQITATEKFKRAILNQNLTDFLVEGEGSLTNGLALPFPILSEVFKGIRQGETTAFAMPSNAGKSRFTINLAAYIALIHQKKVLIISNEMSEEKMKLCLITTIINNPSIQEMHGQKLKVSENELLEFKFRPDNPNSTKVDEKGYAIREEGESQEEFANRLIKISTEFNMVIKVTNWYNSKLYNSIHFINITDHTNDELKKVIMNYYYKEDVQYVFYDTLKTDIENIGNGEELKKTATILSNLAQTYNMYIASTLQLTETTTDPINLSVNDMAVSKTVKEVLDTLCLFKQIRNENLNRYQYCVQENDNSTIELKKYEDPNIRYYSCIVDKNRAGAKPKLLFRLNLAYNSWEELGYLRLKTNDEENID